MRDRLTVPSKTFLFGEYAVLDGAPACVLVHNPKFEIIYGSEKEDEVHPNSPAGKLFKESSQCSNFKIQDPHEKKGGFGRSTAEFIGAFYQLHSSFEPNEIHKSYMNFFPPHLSPSGADLVAQAIGESIIFQKDPFSFNSLVWPFEEEACFLIFRTGRKVETHHHLAKLQTGKREVLKELSQRLLNCFKEKGFSEFCSLIKSFSEQQRELGLLSEFSWDVCARIDQFQDIHFSRGCGAMGADVILVSCRKAGLSNVIKLVLDLDPGLELVDSFSLGAPN